MQGRHGRICRFAVGPVYPSKSLIMCYSDFVFRKYKQNSVFRVSGVLQLAKTGPPVTKSFPLLRLFPSDAIMGWRLYTPYDVNRTNLHILTARGMSHILTRIGQLWRDRKIILRAGPELNYESVQHRPQSSGIKKGAKISFHRHFKQLLPTNLWQSPTDKPTKRQTAFVLNKNENWQDFNAIKTKKTTKNWR